MMNYEKSKNQKSICLSNTLSETNAAPDSQGLEDVSNFLSGADLLVLVLRQCMEHIQISPPSQTFLGEPAVLVLSSNDTTMEVQWP